MRFGVSCGYEWLPALREAGYDYIETAVTGLLGKSDAELVEISRQLEQFDMKTEVVNCFFYPGKSLYSESAEFYRPHAEKALTRAAALGCEIAVIGSGGSRQVPDGMPVEDAKRKFADILTICGEEAEKKGIRIVVEPLREKETNFIHTITEGIEVANMANHPAVGTLIDFFHFHCNGESLSELDTLNGPIYHTHLARPSTDRCFPQPLDIPTVRLWAEKLRKIGYNDRLSLECRFTESNYRQELKVARQVLEVFQTEA